MKIVKICFFLIIPIITFAQNPNERLKSMGIELSTLQAPVAKFVQYKQVENTLYVSGTGSTEKGKLGKDLTKKAGYQAARNTGVKILAKIHEACDGDLSRVKQIVKVRGMVQSTDDFYDQPFVNNGFSDLMVEVFVKYYSSERKNYSIVNISHTMYYLFDPI